MSRTPEQVKADDALTSAIDGVATAYGWVDKDLVNTQYVVVVEQRGWADNGDSLSAFVTLFKDGDMPWTSILGILRAATLKAERDYLESGRTE